MRRSIGADGCDFVMSLLHPDMCERATAESALQATFLSSSSPQPATETTPGKAPTPAATAVGTHSTAAAMQPFTAAQPASPADSASSIYHSGERTQVCSMAAAAAFFTDPPSGPPVLPVGAPFAEMSFTTPQPASHLHTGAGAPAFTFPAGQQTFAVHQAVVSNGSMPHHSQGDHVEGECLDHALHVPHTRRLNSLSLPCTASAADCSEVTDAAAHETPHQVAQQSQNGCGQTGAQTNRDGVGDAGSPPNSKVIVWLLFGMLLAMRVSMLTSVQVVM